MARSITDKNVENFHKALAELECEDAEEYLQQLKRTHKNWYELLGFTTAGQVFRRVGTWCPKARRNYEKVYEWLLDQGFDAIHIYIPKVVLNSDEIIMDVIDNSRVKIVCKKESYPDYKLVYDKTHLIYLFNKLDDKFDDKKEGGK